MAAYAGIISALGIDSYVTYHAGADLGLFTQSIVDGMHGMHNKIEGSHWTFHFSPLLALLTPVLLAVRSPLVLIVVQAVAGALTAPAVYLLARRRMDGSLANMAAIVALLYPPLVGVSFTEFHENGFAPAATAWLIWAVDARRFDLAAVFAAIALGIKEDESYVLTVLGAGYAAWSLYRKDRAAAAFGAVLSAASAIVFLSFFLIVRPLAGAVHPWPPLGAYTAVNHDVARGFSAVSGRLTFLLELLLPLAFLPLFSPWFLLAVPGLVEVLAARWSMTYTMGKHYPGVWISYVLAAFVDRLAVIAKADAARGRRLVNLAALLCAVILVVASPTHWGHYLGLRTAHDRAIDAVVALVPAGASVGAVDEIYVHLSLDPNAQTGYGEEPEYIVVDGDYDSMYWRAIYQPQFDALMRTGAYRPIATDDRVSLYRRMGPGR